MTGRHLAFAFIAVVAISAAPAFAQGDAAKGATVYAAQKCQVCHSIAGKGGKLSLDGVGSKLSAADISEWITNPVEAAKKHKSTAKPLMRAYPKLEKADLDSLVAYMLSLKK
jgi:mono/diheme cytochrome c family protein